jgi:hypothetical protein
MTRRTGNKRLAMDWLTACVNFIWVYTSMYRYVNRSVRVYRSTPSLTMRNRSFIGQRSADQSCILRIWRCTRSAQQYAAHIYIWLNGLGTFGSQNPQAVPSPEAGCWGSAFVQQRSQHRVRNINTVKPSTTPTNPNAQPHTTQDPSKPPRNRLKPLPPFLSQTPCLRHPQTIPA